VNCKVQQAGEPRVLTTVLSRSLKLARGTSSPVAAWQTGRARRRHERCVLATDCPIFGQEGRCSEQP